MKNLNNLSEAQILLGKDVVEPNGLVEETSMPQIQTLTQIEIPKTNLDRATQIQAKQTPAAPKQKDQNQAHHKTLTTRTGNQVNHHNT